MDTPEGYEFREAYSYDVESGLLSKSEGMFWPTNKTNREDYDYATLKCLCGCMNFEVFFPKDYCTAVTCKACGNQQVVHDG